MSSLRLIISAVFPLRRIPLIISIDSASSKLTPLFLRHYKVLQICFNNFRRSLFQKGHVTFCLPLPIMSLIVIAFAISPYSALAFKARYKYFDLDKFMLMERVMSIYIILVGALICLLYVNCIRTLHLRTSINSISHAQPIITHNRQSVHVRASAKPLIRFAINIYNFGCRTSTLHIRHCGAYIVI